MNRNLLSLATVSFTTLLAAGLFAVPGAAKADGPRRVFVASFDAAPAHRDLALALAQEVAQRIDGDKAFNVVTEREVAGLVKHAEKKLRLGCADEGCALASFAGLVDVQEVVIGNVSQQNGTVLLFLARLDPTAQRVLSRASASFAAGQAAARKAGLTTASQQLLYPGANAGDDVLKELNIGVMVDEVEPDGQKAAANAMEACIADVLDQADADVVSPLQMNRVRKLANPASVIDGDALSAVRPEDADVLLVGTTAWKKDSGQNTGFLKRGPQSFYATTTLSMIRVDSGQVIVSKNIANRFPGHSIEQVKLENRDKICQAVTPLLKERLNQRIDRGTRIVVDVKGVQGAKAANELRAKFEKLPRVARVRLRATKDGSARYNVWMRGGDGVRFAIEAEPLGTTLESSSAAQVVLRAR